MRFPMRSLIARFAVAVALPLAAMSFAAANPVGGWPESSSSASSRVASGPCASTASTSSVRIVVSSDYPSLREGLASWSPRSWPGRAAVRAVPLVSRGS